MSISELRSGSGEWRTSPMSVLFHCLDPSIWLQWGWSIVRMGRRRSGTWWSVTAAWQWSSSTPTPTSSSLFSSSDQLCLWNKQRKLLVKESCWIISFIDLQLLSLGRAPGVGDTIDTSKVAGEAGLTLELCAGIIDKDLSEVEIAREEVKEECGYLPSLDRFTQIVKFPSSVGVSGMTRFKQGWRKPICWI